MTLATRLLETLKSRPMTLATRLLETLKSRPRTLATRLLKRNPRNQTPDRWRTGENRVQ
jgi:hypothetical protein